MFNHFLSVRCGGSRREVEGGVGCSGTLSDNYLTYRIDPKTGKNRSRKEHMLSKDVEANLFTVIFARLQ